MDLYVESLKLPFAEHESHAHITVDMKNVSPEGEISSSWLSTFGVATWMDICYNCNHCKQDKKGIKSLNALLTHLKNKSAGKTKIKCTDCERSYSALNSYINHVTKTHHEHLSFWLVLIFLLVFVYFHEFLTVASSAERFITTLPRSSCTTTANILRCWTSTLASSAATMLKASRN